jgi:hypothetical protein
MEPRDEIREQALHPFRDLIQPVGFERVTGHGFIACLHPMPFAQIIEPDRLHPEAVKAAVGEARAIVRDRGKSLLAWWIAPEHEWMAEDLIRVGLVNDVTPGFESIENAMVLVDAPLGGRSDKVVVTEVESLEDLRASNDVSNSAFEVPQDMRDAMEAMLSQQYEEYATPGNSARQFNASIDGVVVGTASAVRGPAGVNLFGGSVVSEARGLGVYRALTHARWMFAVNSGTPALTVQAGRMSRPIVEELGFMLVGQVRVYVDEFAGSPA